MGALRGRGVDADAVVEVEDPERPGPEPDERVERRQQGPSGDAARQPGLGRAVGRRRPALDVDRHQLTGVDQFRDRGLALGRRQAVVVAQVGLRGDAQRRGGAADQGAHRLVALRPEGVHLRREHAFGELVGPAEAAARARGEHPDGEEVLAGHLDVRALPPAAVGAGHAVAGVAEDLRDLARLERAVGLDRLVDGVEDVGPVVERVAEPAALPLLVVAHPPAEQRPVLHRQQARLVDPVLDHRAAPPLRGRLRPGQRVEGVAVVRAEPGEQRRVVRAHGDVDRVELQEAEVARGRREGGAARPALAGGAPEALGGDGRAPRLGGRHLLHVPDPAPAPRQPRNQPARTGVDLGKEF